jgi:hypothetical protein
MNGRRESVRVFSGKAERCFGVGVWAVQHTCYNTAHIGRTTRVSLTRTCTFSFGFKNVHFFSSIYRCAVGSGERSALSTVPIAETFERLVVHCWRRPETHRITVSGWWQRFFLE